MFVNVSFWHLAIVVSLVVIIVAALVSVWKHPGTHVSRKVVWTAVIVLLPYLGALLWLLNLAMDARHRARPSGV